MTSTSDVRPCAFVELRVGGRYGCPALAVPGSAFCPVHERRGTRADPPPTAPARRDPDVDVLPWQPDDKQSFTTIALRQEENRQARRAALIEMARQKPL